uniref:Putative 34 kDa salivary secreted protein n=2 Tax=Culex tarsalis TaxID=7177 RepID=A0A1Q3FCL7_CULTA
MTSLKQVPTIIILTFGTIASFAFPTGNGKPAHKKCHVSQEFLINLKSMITSAIEGSEYFPQNVNTSGHGDCENDLKVIVASLEEIHNETAQIKGTGRSTEEVQDLKNNFQQEIERITKNRDEFELDLKQETLKKEGEIYDKIHDLKRCIQNLKQQIREAEDEFYELAFELVGVRVETNEVGGKEKCYAGMIPKGKFGPFFVHIVANHGYETLLKSLYLLQRIYDPQAMFYEFMEEFRERPAKSEKENREMVVTLMCWITKQEDRIRKTFFEGCNLYYLYKMTTTFFPTSNDGMQAVRLAEPALKSRSGFCDAETIKSHLKELTIVNNKGKYDNFNRFGSCDQFQP